jgi:hypothetical protein
MDIAVVSLIVGSLGTFFLLVVGIWIFHRFWGRG